MDVVEREHNTTGLSERLKKGADGAMSPEALVMQPACTTVPEPLDTGRDGGKLIGLSANQALQAIAAQRRGIVPQSVDHHSERQILLHLGGAPTQDKVSAIICPSRQLVQETRLADPGLAAQRDDRRPASLQPL
jgi:hypothetical protein